ncbi:MAG: hypothetical protein VX519_04950 [Myxococcota bacterium]|nr:hypothetical protein [Myxococcota bacterium]
MRQLVLFLVLGVGCYPESRFEKDVTAAYCNHFFECLEGDDDALALLELVTGWDDAGECIEEGGGTTFLEEDDCLYDSSIARECVGQLEELNCDAAMVPGLALLPGTCMDVYDCD